MPHIPEGSGGEPANLDSPEKRFLKRKWWLSACMAVCLCVYVCLCVSACVSVCQSAELLIRPFPLMLFYVITVGIWPAKTPSSVAKCLVHEFYLISLHTHTPLFSVMSISVGLLVTSTAAVTTIADLYVTT